MQKDFHFYAIYALARRAGFNPQEAEIVAYASQFTDDAYSTEAIYTMEGGVFLPVQTSHNYHGIEWYESLSQEIGFRVWIPFHFVPGLEAQTENLFERLRVRPVKYGENNLLNALFFSLKEARRKPFALYLLGIYLHVLADTWSHQGFIGLTRQENDVSELEINRKRFRSFGDFLRFLQDELEEAIHDVFPKTGHAEALFVPDEPFRKWSYRDFWDELHRIDNVERSVSGARECWRFIKAFRGEEEKGFEKIEQRLADLFSREGKLEERCQWWREAISEGVFFECTSEEKEVSYDPGRWLEEAVVRGAEGLKAKEGFERSSYYHFHQAARLYRYLWQENFPYKNWRGEKGQEKE